MKDFNSNTANNEEWLTPPYIVAALGPFDLDPCAPVTRPWPMARNHYTIEDDGLSKPWNGRVWCNPPYGKKTFTWLDKLAAHPGGGIALVFARTETVGFHNTVWTKAKSVFFFKGRLCFHTVDGKKGDTANAPSCLVAYTDFDTNKIISAMNFEKIKGRLVNL